MSNSKAESKTIQIKLVKSGIGFPEKQKKVIQGLGFSRLNQVITRPDTPQIRGMIFKIKHLVEVVQQ
jgi:large subunit ribosomal protein L30